VVDAIFLYAEIKLMFHVHFADNKKQLTQKEASFWETSSDGEVQ